MTTVSQIITDAYRESNLIALNASPTADEQTEALRLLNRVVKGLFGYEFGEPLKPLPLGKENIETPDAAAPYMDDILSEFIPENTRLFCNLENAVTLNLHPAPLDGCRFGVIDVSGNFNTYNVTLVGNGRKIENGTTHVLSTNHLNQEWFYRADLADWKKLTDLALTDDSPFPEEFDDLLILNLALRLSPRVGAELSGASQLQLQRLEKKFRARYRQKGSAENEVTMISSSNGYTGSSRLSFITGIPRW